MHPIVIGSTGDHLVIPVNSGIAGHTFRATIKYSTTCPVYSSKNITITPPDGDGNYYTAVKVGRQLWMTSNLRSTRFNDGSPMQYGPNNYGIAYSWFGNDSLLNAKRYGALYNIQVINNSMGKNVCPKGWQVADMMNWLELLENIGGQKNSAILLKSSNGWNDAAQQSNTYNFNALPGGQVNAAGNYDGQSLLGTWWGLIPKAVSPATIYQASYFEMIINDNNVYFIDPAGTSNDQHSIRCILR